MFLREVIDEIVFSSQISFNGMLINHCVNLSTHHYQVTYLLYFDTQFRQSQSTQQYFCAVAIRFRKKAIELPFCTKEIGKEL